MELAHRRKCLRVSRADPALQGPGLLLQVLQARVAGELGIGASAADELASLVMVHTEDGIVKVEYPFSGVPTTHRVSTQPT